MDGEHFAPVKRVRTSTRKEDYSYSSFSENESAKLKSCPEKPSGLNRGQRGRGSQGRQGPGSQGQRSRVSQGKEGPESIEQHARPENAMEISAATITQG